MKLLTKGLQETYENGKTCCICKKKLKIDIGKITDIVKLEIIAIIQEEIEMRRIG